MLLFCSINQQLGENTLPMTRFLGHVRRELQLDTRQGLTAASLVTWHTGLLHLPRLLAPHTLTHLTSHNTISVHLHFSRYYSYTEGQLGLTWEVSVTLAVEGEELPPAATTCASQLHFPPVPPKHHCNIYPSSAITENGTEHIKNSGQHARGKLSCGVMHRQ